ncbi:MAG TPA: thiamine pyrophosphate-dependent enzyme [Candidatus Binatia bacterium]|jgi:thiamine pyrophosphate-dependent acetolactate synthase large subunit-like protein|nr:thiamine pyrophosphate-dependent enzyme [Candidatus Binatia bacterium]
MNRIEVLRYIATLRNGDPMIISPGLANYTIGDGTDEPLTLYNMDMPYTTPMALGMALGWPERRVISVEGDGSLLAGPGVLTTVARYQPKNLVIFVFDNGAYLTTGSGKAPTATAFGTDIEQLARAAGMKNTRTVADIDSAKGAVRTAFTEPGPWLVVAKVDKQDRPAERIRSALPMHVYEAGLVFYRAASQERAAKK